MKNRKIIFGLFLLAFLQGCSSVWLGEKKVETVLEGDRLNVIFSTSDDLNVEGFLSTTPNISSKVYTPSSLVKDWDVNISEKGVINYIPVIKGDKIYTVDKDFKVSCFNLATGNKNWSVLVSRKKESLDGIFGGGLSTGSDSLLVSTGFGDLLSLNEENGAMLWRYSSIAPFNSAPYVQSNIVIATNIENETIALEEKTGNILWKHKGSPEDVSIMANLTIASNSKLIVPTYNSGEVVAIIPQNGRVIWSDTLGLISKNVNINSISNISASSVFVGNVVVATGLDNQMVAFDANTGDRIWHKKIKYNETPIVIGDAIVLKTDRNELVAISSVNGGVYWKVNLDSLYGEEKVLWSNMSVYENQIVLNNSSEDLVFFSILDGKMTFKADITAYSNASPVFDGDFFYIISNNGKLKSYHLN